MELEELRVEVEIERLLQERTWYTRPDLVSANLMPGEKVKAIRRRSVHLISIRRSQSKRQDEDRSFGY